MANALEEFFREEVAEQKKETDCKTSAVSTGAQRAKYDGKEARTRRVQLLMKPSLYQQVQEYAESKNISCNAAIEKMLQEYLEHLSKQ